MHKNTYRDYQRYTYAALGIITTEYFDDAMWYQIADLFTHK